jgi:hypothetical protein
MKERKVVGTSMLCSKNTKRDVNHYFGRQTVAATRKSSYPTQDTTTFFDFKHFLSKKLETLLKRAANFSLWKRRWRKYTGGR